MKRQSYKQCFKYLKRNIIEGLKDKDLKRNCTKENDCEYLENDKVIKELGCGACIKLCVQNFWNLRGCYNPVTKKWL